MIRRTLGENENKEEEGGGDKRLTDHEIHEKRGKQRQRAYSHEMFEKWTGINLFESAVRVIRHLR